MSEKSDFIRLETILKYIEDINTIIDKHNSIDNALNDMEGAVRYINAFNLNCRNCS